MHFASFWTLVLAPVNARTLNAQRPLTSGYRVYCRDLLCGAYSRSLRFDPPLYAPMLQSYPDQPIKGKPFDVFATISSTRVAATSFDVRSPEQIQTYRMRAVVCSGFYCLSGLSCPSAVRAWLIHLLAPAPVPTPPCTLLAPLPHPSRSSLSNCPRRSWSTSSGRAPPAPAR